MPGKVTVVARTKARPGCEGIVKRNLIALATITRGETGCINYDLHQSLDEPCLFLLYENWQSADHLDKHMQTPHFKEFVSKMVDLLSEPPEITLWEQLG